MKNADEIIDRLETRLSVIDEQAKFYQRHLELLAQEATDINICIHAVKKL